MSLRYEAVRTYFTTTNAPNGDMIDVITNYERTEPQERRGYAITLGFETWGHDDFNIAVWKGDRLKVWDWMDESVETDPTVLETIERALLTGKSIPMGLDR
jgi:hypothetical protein